MSENVSGRKGERRFKYLLIAGGAAILALELGAFLDPDRAFPALLAATFFGLGLPLGAMALLDIHRLTGGAWGRALRPTLIVCARTLPGFFVALFVLALGLHRLYPWAQSAASVRPAVANVWLWTPSFLARGLIYFGVWTIWLRAVLGERRSVLGAGLGLVFYAVTISLAAADWAMSIEPDYASSVYGALIAIEQIASVLAFVALMRVGATATKTTSDLAQLLLASLLGVAYLAFMQFLVVWSGDLPNRIDHYVARSDFSALSVIGVASLVGLVLPFLILVDEDRREDEIWTARAGACALAALALTWTWRIGLAAQPLSLAWGCVAFLALGAPWLAFVLPRAERMTAPAAAGAVAAPETPAPALDPVIRLRIATPMESQDGEEDEASATEPPAIRIGPIVGIAAGFAATIAATLVLIAVAFKIEDRPLSNEWRGPLPHYPAPRLQIAPRADLTRLEARQTARLTNQASMPIDEAMRRVVARGAQAYAPWTKPAPAPGSTPGGAP